MNNDHYDVTEACGTQGPFKATEAAQGSADGAALSSLYSSWKELFVLRIEQIKVEIVYGLKKIRLYKVSLCYVRTVTVNRVSVSFLN